MHVYTVGAVQESAEIHYICKPIETNVIRRYVAILLKRLRYLWKMYHLKKYINVMAEGVGYVVNI